MTAKNKSNKIEITRIYDAPVKVVWDAWTDPKQAAKWWGPRGFTITTHSKDLRTGGHWAYTMHGPDGVDYPNKAQYLEVENQSRLIYDHGGNDDRPALFRVTVNFSESDGKTKMEMSMALPTPEAAEETRKFIKKASGDSTWDRLAEFLSKESTGQEIFVINRSFETPIKAMYEMWTNPKHFSKWLAPTGFHMNFIRSEIKPGSSTFYCMTDGGSMKMYGRAEYRELVSPNHIVYTQQFCDEKEKVIRHPNSPTWPETMLTTITFTEESQSQTRVTIRWEAFGKVTEAELNTFTQGRSGMTQGWTGSLDKLEDYASSI